MKPLALAPLLLALSFVVPATTTATPAAFRETDLVSDVPGAAQHLDANLVNPWGLAVGPVGQIQVAANGAGLFTSYDRLGNPRGAIVTIPPPGDGAPTSFVWVPGSSDHDRGGAYVFVTENGTVDVWRPGVDATTATEVAHVTDGVFKGIATARVDGGRLYFVANFHAGEVDVFDSHFQLVAMTGAFVDATLPDGFAPFNLQSVGGHLLVTYAKQKPDKHDNENGAGGYVDVFDLHGKLLRRLVSNGPLDAPWGIAVAPPHFGSFGGALLIGNFGDGTVNAFNPDDGSFLGSVADTSGKAIHIEGLWGLAFQGGGEARVERHGDDDEDASDGVASRAGDDSSDRDGRRGDDREGTARLYFTAGIDDEAHGLMGFIAPARVHSVEKSGHDEPAGPSAIRVTPLGASPVRLAAQSGVSFRIGVPVSSSVTLRVYDASGRLVASPLEQFAITGESTVQWDGRDVRGIRVAPGTYFYRATSGAQSASGRLVIIR